MSLWGPVHSTLPWHSSCTLPHQLVAVKGTDEGRKGIAEQREHVVEKPMARRSGSGIGGSELVF